MTWQDIALGVMAGELAVSGVFFLGAFVGVILKAGLSRK